MAKHDVCDERFWQMVAKALIKTGKPLEELIEPLSKCSEQQLKARAVGVRTDGAKNKEQSLSDMQQWFEGQIDGVFTEDVTNGEESGREGRDESGQRHPEE